MGAGNCYDEFVTQVIFPEPAWSGCVAHAAVQNVFDGRVAAAQSIAERYRTVIEYQQPTETVIKLRVKLPLGQVPQG